MKRYLFLILLIATCSLSVMGQSYYTFSSEMSRIAERTRFKIGPFRLYPTFSIRNIGYDDNVYYRREQDDPISDYTATLSPEIQVNVLFRNYLILSFTENPAYLFYFNQTRERSWNNSLSSQFKLLLFNRFVLTGSYDHSSRKIRATSEFSARIHTIDSRYRMGLYYETPRQTALGLSASSGRLSYGNESLEDQNILYNRALGRREKAVELEFYYRIFSESSLFMNLGYSEYNFNDPGYRWRDAHSYHFDVGIRFPLMGRMQGLLSVGYRKMIPEEEGRKSFSGFSGNGEIEYRFNRFRFRLAYGRNNRFSYFTDTVYFTEQRIGGGISFYLTRFLRLSYDIRYGENQYPESVDITLPGGSTFGLRRKDFYRTHTFGFAFRVVGSTGIGFDVDWWERSSNYYFEERNRYFVGVSITQDF